MPTQLDWYLQLNLKTRQLRLLVALDDFGSLKKVAEALHVTLPAVSKGLAELEKGLGLELFTRTPHGVRPTIYGECLIRYARGMLTDVQQVRDELMALGSGSGGKVNVGVYHASSSLLMPHALALLKQRSPATNARVAESTSPVLLPQLWEGKLDLVVGRLPAVRSSSGFDATPLVEEQLIVVASPNHPLARQKRVQWPELKKYPWVLPPLASSLREPIERLLAQHGIELEKNYVETMSVDITRAYLELSSAIAIVANAAPHDALQPLAVLPLPLPRMLLRPAGVLWNRNRPLSPAAELMIECLQEAATAMRERETAAFG